MQITAKNKHRGECGRTKAVTHITSVVFVGRYLICS